MKIAVSGKGGVGKTTVAALIALEWVRRGERVLAIDADPDPNLASALGFEDVKSILPISQMKGLMNERLGVQKDSGSFFRLNPQVDDIPGQYRRRQEGLDLLVLGTVDRGGGGCACPHSVFLRSLLKVILVGENGHVIVDFEAGVEHLGRRSAESVDRMIIVLEPSLRSVETGQRIERLAGDLGLHSVVWVANKVAGPQDLEFLRSHVPAEKLLAVYPQCEVLARPDGCVRDALQRHLDLSDETKRLCESLLHQR